MSSARAAEKCYVPRCMCVCVNKHYAALTLQNANLDVFTCRKNCAALCPALKRVHFHLCAVHGASYTPVRARARESTLEGCCASSL